jgi:hypothetical protein
MKKQLLRVFITAAIVILSVAAVFAQSDVIYLHNGQTINGKVSTIGETMVSFSYENEDALQTVGKYAVEKIVYGKSGRVQHVTDKIVINGREDWEKVIILENREEIAGLTRKGEVKGKTAFINYRTGEGSDKTALKKLKMSAAENGCAFVNITTDKDIDRKGATGGADFGQLQSIKKGVGYSYN